jgi:hypothetical protein
VRARVCGATQIPLPALLQKKPHFPTLPCPKWEQNCPGWVDLHKEVPMKQPEQATWAVTHSAIVHAGSATPHGLALFLGHSTVKLAQVVIRMQISPAHPVFRCHFSEDGMGQAGVWQAIAEPV